MGADDDESVRTLRDAMDHGVDFFDTAIAYGDGHSERLVGQAVRESGRDDIFVATKAITKDGNWPARDSSAISDMYPADWIVASAERSLKNLGLERIDLLQLHTWADHWLEDDGWRQAAERLRHEGKIRYFGVSLNNHEAESGLRLVESGSVDAVQVIFNVFDQSPADALIQKAAERGVAVIARSPLDEGGLSGRIDSDITFPEEDFRNVYFGGDRRREVSERVATIAEKLEVEVGAVPSFALRFCWAHPEIATVIVGMRSRQTLALNLEIESQADLSGEEVDLLRSCRWQRDFYADLYA